MNDEYVLVFNTCPDGRVARTLAERLVAAKLAACVNIVPGLVSVYQWQGKIERSSEHLLLIKTHHSRYQALERELRQHHPYELPEIVAVPLSHGLPAYLSWIAEAVEVEEAK